MEETWIKVRHKYGNHKGNWDFIEIEEDNFDDNLEEAIRDYESTVDPYWPYRSLYDGVEHMIIDKPPKEWLLKQSNNMKTRLEKLKKQIRRYEALQMEKNYE